MKPYFSFLILLLFGFCVNRKQTEFIGSTPADPVVRNFLGISLNDSIDFIRWELIVLDGRYRLVCNYGIGQPNTNGFMNGGKILQLNGKLTKQQQFYTLFHNGKALRMAEVNNSLLHFVGSDDKLLVGNAGWSFTLNNKNPVRSDKINIKAIETALNDSMVYVGRTPCRIPGIIAEGQECYKLKWKLILYPNPVIDQPGTYRIFGTPWRKEGGVSGTWSYFTTPDGRVLYRLLNDNGGILLNLLKLDDNIFVFGDEKLELLVGDEDFSYTLNREFY